VAPPPVKRALIAGAAVAAALGAMLLVVRARGPRVDLERTKRRTIVPIVSGAGEIRRPEAVGVPAGVIGRIKSIPVRPGDAVRKGDVVVELDRTAYEAQASEATAAAARASEEAGRAAASLESASRKYARAIALAGKKMASGDYLQAARGDVARARAARDAASSSLASARERLASAREALSRTRITSPRDGEIVAVHAKIGETVTERLPVVSVAEKGSTIAVPIPADSVRRFPPGSGASVRAAGSREEIRGEVRGLVAPNKTGDSAYVSVMIALPSSSSALAPGSAARVRIEGPPIAGALAVPISALSSPARVRRRESGVFLPLSGRARWRAVVVGVRDERFAEIVSGLAEGEEIVAGPFAAVESLSDGDRIRPRRKEE